MAVKSENLMSFNTLTDMVNSMKIRISKESSFFILPRPSQNLFVVNSPNAAFIRQSALICKSSSQLGCKYEHNTHGFVCVSRIYPSEQDKQRIPVYPLAQDLL